MAHTRTLLAALLLLAAGACAGPRGPRPSILLVVMDTVRADAVSAYQLIGGTTPNLDALAEDGLVYTLAFAPSPWTLPSHASLLTGLSVDRHGVGLHGRMAVPEELVTLAERLRDQGYQTAGFSENPLVSPPFRMAQGFEHFASKTVEQRIAESRGAGGPRFDVVQATAHWARTRDARQPWFVFVNLFDAHDPYSVRETNPFLPPGVDGRRAHLVQRLDIAPHAWVAQAAGICGRLPPAEDLAILRGLYLGEVAAADAKLGQIWRLLRKAAAVRDLVTIVTSDHGEHLGEHRLLGHEFSVRNVALHVPLVVHGLPGVQPGRRDAPVELVDLVPSILEWVGAEVPEELSGRPLPLAAGGPAAERDLVAVFSDEMPRMPESVRRVLRVSDSAWAAKRAGCEPADRVFGDIASLTRYPFKLIWYEQNAPQLYDLSWDPNERSDLASHHPDRVAGMQEGLEAQLEALGLPGSGPAPAVPPEALRALRGLGYID